MTTTTDTAFPADLASVLAKHGVPATVDGVLAEFEERDRCVCLAGPFTDLHPANRWSARADGARSWFAKMPTVTGPTSLTALARAFAAMVDSEGEG